MTRKIKLSLIISTILLVISLLSLGYAIYKRNHTGPDTTSVDTSASYQIKRQQVSSASIKIPILTPAQEVENSQRKAIISFYSAYPDAKADKVTQLTYITKYSTAKMLTQFSSQTSAQYNPLFCGPPISSPSVTVNNVVGTAKDGATFMVRILSGAKLESEVQVSVVKTNNIILIDKAGCPGPI